MSAAISVSEQVIYNVERRYLLRTSIMSLAVPVKSRNITINIPPSVLSRLPEDTNTPAAVMFSFEDSIGVTTTPDGTRGNIFCVCGAIQSNDAEGKL